MSSRPAVEHLEARRFLASTIGASLDPAFGDHGTLAVGASWAQRASILRVQTDGKLLVAGAHSGAMSVARYLPDGRPDPSFGDAGRILTDPNPAADDAATALALAPDGSILVAGPTSTPSPGGGSATIVLARYTPSGQPDASFGTAGVARHDYFPTTRPPTIAPSSLVLQPDGKIVLAGTIRPDNLPASGVVLHRYDADGTPDATFGTNGVADASFPGAGYETHPVLGLQPDGRIVMVTAVGDDRFGPNRTGVRRFDPAGQPDPSYPITEMREFLHNDAIFTAAGGVVIAGYAWTSGTDVRDVALLALNPDGSRSDQFGNEGFALANLGSDTRGSIVHQNADIAEAAAFDPTGSVVVAAHTFYNFRDRGAIVLLRYDPRGNLDLRIGGPSGVLGYGSPRRSRAIIDMAVAPDGDVLMLYSVDVENGTTYEVTRHAPRATTQPAPTAKVVRGILRVRGTRGDDVLRIAADDVSRELVVTANETTLRFPAAGVQRLSVVGLRGDDVLAVDPAIRLPAVLSGGPGDDHLTGGRGPDRLAGGPGADHLDAFDFVSDVLAGGPGIDSAERDDRDRPRGIESFGP